MTVVSTPAPQYADRHDPAPALKAFFDLAEKWRLTAEEQIVLLGAPGRSTFFKWKREGGLPPRDTLERISYLLGIYKALHILFPDDAAADAWVRKPNAGPMFEDRSAMDVMLRGDMAVLMNVRRYLDAQRGGWS